MSKLIAALFLTFSHTVTFALVGELNAILTKEKSRFFQTSNFLTYDSQIKEQLSQSQSIKIDQDFLSSVLIRSSAKDHKFIHPQSQCSLLSYLISGQARDALGKTKKIIINYRQGEKILKTMIPLKDFFDLYAQKNCPQLISSQTFKNRQLFYPQVKQLLSLIPKKSHTCSQDLLRILKSPYIFYICSSFQKKHNQKELTKQENLFLENLCLSHKKPAKICQDIFEINYWQQISQGKAPSYYAQTLCVPFKNLKQCLKKLSQDKELCHFPPAHELGLTPLQNCQEISLALNHSNLNANYPECPIQIENMGIVNSTRIINHFQKNTHPYKKSECLSYPLKIFADFNHTIGNPLAWDYQLCYTDKVSQEEKCFPSIIGAIKDSPYSQEKVITQILRNKYYLNESQTCKMIHHKKYNPLLLKFKSGCYILSNLDYCTLNDCKFKVINNSKEIKDIIIKEHKFFDYIPQSRKNKHFSQISLITSQLKKRSKEIRNLSMVKKFFKDHPSGIIHGLGCAENLLPSFFPKSTLWQCSPLPFIIDGYVIKNQQTLLVLTSALDHLHTPRLTKWSRIFSATKLLYEIHPFKRWSLHGLY